MLKKRTFFLVGGFLCLMILVAIGYRLYTKPHASAAGETAVLSIGADSLYRLYQSDEQSADRKYLGKVIEVTGKISEIQHNGKSEIWILSAQPGGGGVNCQMFPGATQASTKSRPGDLVKIKGRCTGFLMDVNLADCIVSK